MCGICVSLLLVRSIPESRFPVLFFAYVFSLNPIFELLLSRGNTEIIVIIITISCARTCSGFRRMRLRKAFADVLLATVTKQAKTATPVITVLVVAVVVTRGTL